MTSDEAKYALIVKAGYGRYGGFIEDVIDQIFKDHKEELKQSYIDGSKSCNDLIQHLYAQIEGNSDNISDCEPFIGELPSFLKEQ